MVPQVVGRAVRAVLAAAALVVLVAGVPWGLWRYIGWPLPARVPTVSEVQVVLLGPMHSTLLLNVLACMCWIVWAAFSVDVARCTRDAVHDLRMPGGVSTVRTSRSPTHAVAALLVGAIALSIIGNRAAAPLHTGPLQGEHRGDTGTAASAMTWHTPPPHPISGDPTHVGLRPVGYLVGQSHDPGRQDLGLRDPGQEDAGQGEPVPDSVVVRSPDPRTGIHDSLWRIADRTLGDGARWPEIFELNQGKPQPDGGTLVRPSLIFPGEELRLPTLGPNPAHSDQPPSLVTPVPELPGTSSPQQPGEDVPAVPDRTTLPDPALLDPAGPPDHLPGEVPEVVAPVDPGLSWGPEMYVGIGLASAISAALLVARRRHRRRYRPGSGRRDDLPVAPVIYQLRLAHLRTAQDPDHNDEQNRPGAAGHGTPAHSAERVRTAGEDLEDAEFDDAQVDDDIGYSVVDSDLYDVDESGPAWSGGETNTDDRAGAGAGAPVVGTRGGRELALDLAAARGLGLVGPGAPASARALLIDTLADRRNTDGAGQVVVPVADLVALLGPSGAAVDPPAALHVADTLDDALDQLDELILARTGEYHLADSAHAIVVLVAQPEQRHRARLQSILDNGSSVGIVGILLGQWQPGVTAYVNEDGTVSATSPGAGEALRGARLFHLGETETSHLLSLLHRAQPEPVDPALPEPPADPFALDPSSPDTINPAPAGHEDDALVDAESEHEDDRTENDSGPVPSLDLEPRPVHDPPPRPHPVGPTETPAATTEPEGEDPSAPLAGRDEPGLPERARVRVTVLGRPQVHWRPTPVTDGAGPDGEREITAALQPRTRELLTFLAVHPAGVRREVLVDNLWPDSPPDRTTSALNSALTRLRRVLTDATHGVLLDIVDADDGRIRLDPTVVEVDFWEFEDAVAASRAATTTGQRHDAHHRIVDAYGGTLADGMTAAWIEPARESVRRTALDAVVALAREIHEVDPQKALDLLETARAFDPYNEAIYRSVIRMQATLGLLDAIPRTLALLTKRLAESGDRPDPGTVALAERAAQPPERRAGTPPISPRPNRSPEPGPPAVGRRRAG